jgi:hypothetical protein
VQQIKCKLKLCTCATDAKICFRNYPFDPFPRVTALCKGMVFGLWILTVVLWLHIV